MAVKTTISERDFIQILSGYEIGNYVYAEPVSQGTVQTNYFIYTTKGKAVFRYYENRSKGSVFFESDLLAYLISRKYPCPKPYPNRQGSLVGEYHKKPYVIFEYIDGQPVEFQNTEQKRQLIQKVAQLQVITQDYQPKYWKYRWNYDVELCQKLAKEAAQKINTEDAYRKLSWLENQLSLLVLPGSIPKGICHCDFHYSNALFKDNVLVGLIDFDDANYTYLMFDLVCLIDWEWPYPAVALDFEIAKKIVGEYMKYRQLGEIEQEYTFDVHKLGILFDCVWSFERGESDDFYEKRKVEFLNDLGREQYFGKLFAE